MSQDYNLECCRYKKNTRIRINWIIMIEKQYIPCVNNDQIKKLSEEKEKL